MKDWIKNNWAALLVFAVVLFAALWLKNKFDEAAIEDIKHQYADQMAAQQKSHDAQVKELTEINKQALAKQAELALQHQKNLEDLQIQYEEKMLELDELKKIKVKELTKQLTDDPEVAVEELAHKFGFDVIVVPEEDL
jgi:Skp family chaperone for outer membrane proteins